MSKETRKVMRTIRRAENLVLRVLFKSVLILLALALQILVFWTLYNTTHIIYNTEFYVYNIVRILAIVYLITRHDSSQYKIPWMLFIMFLPALGIAVYILWGNSRIRIKKQVEIKDIENSTNYLFDDPFNIETQLKKEDKITYNMLQYIQNITSYTVCKNDSSKYYDLGEKYFADLKEDLKKAKSYIFLEYYIIDKGELSSEVFEILKQKAKEGVDIKIVYDSFGCFGKFTGKSKIDLKRNGIEIYSFNKISVLINSYLNNRTHRKIACIDGKIAYTGGVNLADEYANIKEKFGHWKDTGVRLEGEVAWNFTLMFLRDLQYIIKSRRRKIDWDKYKKVSDEVVEKEKNGEGLAIAISDGPNNRKNPIETLYMQLLNTAHDYVYIATPYFAISEQMLTAILNSARSGVDVRIVLPYIPDKKIVQMVNRSYYEVLLSAGVKVYEYLPGFIHSKNFVSDDKIALVGSANMDYRSMNLNYECTAMLYKTGTELDVKRDFEIMFEESCKEVMLKDWIQRPFLYKVIQAILTTFASIF